VVVTIAVSHNSITPTRNASRSDEGGPILGCSFFAYLSARTTMLLRLSNRSRALSISALLASAQVHNSFTLSTNEPPKGVSEYSTFGGTLAYNFRTTKPSRSKSRRVTVNIFWLIPSMARRNSAKRRVPEAKRTTINTAHLSARWSRIIRLGQSRSFTVGRTQPVDIIRAVGVGEVMGP